MQKEAALRYKAERRNLSMSSADAHRHRNLWLISGHQRRSRTHPRT